MAEYRVKRPLQRPSIHPGEILREDVLPALGLSVSETAKRLGVSRQQLHRIFGLHAPHHGRNGAEDRQTDRQRSGALAEDATES